MHNYGQLNMSPLMYEYIDTHCTHIALLTRCRWSLKPSPSVFVCIVWSP